MSLETIEGNLRDAYLQLQPGTMLHVDQLMNERQTNENLRNKGFYTGDGEIYFLDAGKTPTLAITREAYNPVLKNIGDAFEQLVNCGGYPVNKNDLEQALAATDTVQIALPNLRLLGDEKEWRYLAIGTTPSKYGRLNDEERKFVERVYGKGDDFPNNMKMLEYAKIGETRIYVLNPNYVREHVKEGAIARASWLYDFYIISQFDAIGRNVNDHDRVRGVRRGASVSEQVAPAGRDAQNLGPYRKAAENVFAVHYDAILADPEGAVKALNDKTVAGLAGLMQMYLSTRGQ